MSPSGPADGKFVIADKMLVESVTIVVNRIQHFFLRNNTCGNHFFFS